MKTKPAAPLPTGALVRASAVVLLAVGLVAGCPQNVVVGVHATGTGGAVGHGGSSTTVGGGGHPGSSTSGGAGSPGHDGGCSFGGGGMGPFCSFATDCGINTACTTFACVSGALCCDVTYAPAGTACTEQGGTTCDGKGTCIATCTSAGDCPSRTCSTAKCTNHTCAWGTAAAGTSCSGSAPCCNGTCVDLASDPNNCGDCGHSCGGASCQGSLCAATTLVPVVQQHYVTSIAVNASTLFWGTQDGMVMSVPTAGGTATLLAAGQGSGQIAIDAANLYWNDGNQNLVSCALTGCNDQPTKLAAVGSNGPIVADGKNVYWVTGGTGGTVMKVPVVGGSPTLLAFGQNSPMSLAVDATRVYWMNQDASLVSVPIGGGNPTMLVPSQGVNAGTDFGPIAVHATSVYWANSILETILLVPVSGGKPSTFVTQVGTVRPTSVLPDATSLYWTNMGASPATGSVMRVALGGGTPIALATGEDSPGPIALDATSVYWATSSAIKKAPK